MMRRCPSLRIISSSARRSEIGSVFRVPRKKNSYCLLTSARPVWILSSVVFMSSTVPSFPFRAGQKTVKLEKCRAISILAPWHGAVDERRGRDRPRGGAGEADEIVAAQGCPPRRGAADPVARRARRARRRDRRNRLCPGPREGTSRRDGRDVR